MSNTQILKIDSKAPEFPGFYCTNYEYDDSFILEDLNEQYGIENVDYVLNNSDFYDFVDCKKYMEDISKAYVILLNEELKNYEILKEIKFEFEEVVSPKEYNFSNDEIYCQMVLEKGHSTINKIVRYLQKNKEDFEEWCKENYSSRSGFISFMPNNSSEFISELREYIEIKQFQYKDGGKYLTEAVRFIIFMEDSGLYDDIHDNIETSYISLECFDYSFFETKLPKKIRKELN